MKRIRILGITLCAIAVAVSACKDKKGGPSGHEKKVSGVVTDPFGHPIADAAVVADKGATVRTDATGAYALPFDSFKSRYFVVSRPGFTEHKVQHASEQMKPIELIPVPPGEGLFLIGPAELIPLELKPLPVTSPGFYALATATYTKLPRTTPMRIVVSGPRTAGIEIKIKEVTQGDSVGFGPGVTLNPTEKVLPITGGGELLLQVHMLTPAPDKRWGLGRFAGRNSPPEQDRALLFTVE